MGKCKEAKAILEGKLAVSPSLEGVSALSEAWQSEQMLSVPDLNPVPAIDFCIQRVVGVVSPLLSEDRKLKNM